MLNSKKLALAGGIVWAIFWFLFFVFVLVSGYGLSFINFMLSSFIPAYQLNWIGTFLILIFSFIDGFIFFYLLALIYNALNKKKLNIHNNDEIIS